MISSWEVFCCCCWLTQTRSEFHWSIVFYGFVQWCLRAYSLEKRETRPPARQHAHGHLGCTVNQNYYDHQCCRLLLASWTNAINSSHMIQDIEITQKNTCLYQHLLTKSFKYGFCVAAGIHVSWVSHTILSNSQHCQYGRSDNGTR